MNMLNIKGFCVLLMMSEHIRVFYICGFFLVCFVLSIKLKLDLWDTRISTEDLEWHIDTSVIIFKCNTYCNYWDYYLTFP